MNIVTGLIVVGLVFLTLTLRDARTLIPVRDGRKYYIRELSWREHLSLLVRRRIYVGLRSREEWDGGSLPHFIFKCPAHGYVVSYPYGLREELRCPQCEPEFLERLAEAE